MFVLGRVYPELLLEVPLFGFETLILLLLVFVGTLVEVLLFGLSTVVVPALLITVEFDEVV